MILHGHHICPSFRVNGKEEVVCSGILCHQNHPLHLVAYPVQVSIDTVGQCQPFIPVQQVVTNNDLKGKWAILFFYPADFTFVCPTELVDMAEKYDQFKAMGVEIYSVSTDSHFVHKAWHDTSESIRKIQYPMLADPTGALSRALGVYIEEEGMAYRGTFVVNPEGKIKVVELNDNNIGRDASELLRKVEAAQFVASHDGEVCPAKWKKGESTLKPSIDLVGKI